MNCCNDQGQCTQGYNCPARESKMPAHDKEPTCLPNQWVEGYIEAIRTAVTALLGLAFIIAAVYLSWVP